MCVGQEKKSIEMTNNIKNKLISETDSKSMPEKKPIDNLNLKNVSGGVEFLEGKIIIPPKMPKSEPYFPDIYQPCTCEYCGREFTSFARRDYHISREHPNAKKDGKANTSTNDKFLI